MGGDQIDFLKNQNYKDQIMTYDEGSYDGHRSDY